MENETINLDGGYVGKICVDCNKCFNKNSEENEIIKEFREQLAAIEHERWADWQKYYLSKLRYTRGNKSYFMGSGLVDHWQKQIETPYSKLTEEEKDSDRKQVDRYFPLILTKLKEKDDEIKRLTLMFQTTTFDLSSAENKLKEEYQRGYTKGVFDHSARLEDVINEASEKARQEGYEVGFAQAESGLPNPMIEFIRKDERMKRDEEIAMLLENIVMNHVEETNNSIHVRMLKKIINNLKN